MTDSSPDLPAPLESVGRAVDRWLPGDSRATGAVVAVTVVALVARLYALGYRVMHFDEGRVAYWAYRFTETGDWHYRYIIHGPLLQHADRWLFAFLGPTDFAARLPVALVGGLLPLSALLFREHLRDGETIALSVLLAANPILLYYSRFMRSDVLVAGFMLVALGFLVRLYDHRRPADLLFATVFLALAFASKENAVVYLLSWGGMLATVAGLELLWPRRFPSRSAAVGAVRDRVVAWGRWFYADGERETAARRVGVPLVLGAGAVAVFGLLTVFFYAPRGAGGVNGTAGIWQSGPAAAVDATVAALERGFGHWGDTGIPKCYGGETWLTETANAALGGWEDGTNYLCNLGRELTILYKGAAALAALSFVGFVADQRSRVPRVLVAGAFFWGLASVVGYPAGTDITYPSWLAVHVVVPLAIPAAVGLALLGRWGLEALADDERVDAALSGLLVAIVVLSMVANAAQVAYVAPQAGTTGGIDMAQYAQPRDHMQDAVATLDRVSAENEGVDVVVYGSDFVDHGSIDKREPACIQWLIPMAPLSWYLYRADAEVRCAENESELRTVLAENDPPIVISSEQKAGVPNEVLGGTWAAESYALRLGDSPSRTAVFYFDTEQVEWEADARQD